MSFQQFRITPLSLRPEQSLITPLTNVISHSSLSRALGLTQQTPVTAQSQSGPSFQILQQVAVPLTNSPASAKKGLYGSGEADDGYTLTFSSMDEFQGWRSKEEEEKMVEFVKGDTHGSKAVPPRFKDHTKLVCARHTRSGRKKYVKKFPERVRKVPSRKLEGQGCPASISYKTYFDSDQVRVCYVSEHSHEIGLANLPFTKRGRKVQQQFQPSNRSQNTRGDIVPESEESTSPPPVFPPDDTSVIAGSSSLRPTSIEQTSPQQNHMNSVQDFQSAIDVLPAPPPPAALTMQANFNQERWERMSVLFQAVRNNARNLEYPGGSVAALEAVLLRLYLESPINTAIPINGG